MKSISVTEIKLSEKEVQEAVRVLRSGALRQGNECDCFEKEFNERVGAQYSVTCSSGTAALHLAYSVFLQPGDEVLVPSFTFIATGSMVMMAGGKPVFCDVDPETFLIDLEDAESRITANTKVIAPVHLFGNSCNVGDVTAFAEKYNLIVVWDAAQAHGARFRGKDIGRLGDFVCYSFYPSKNMFVGEGGIVCTNTEENDRKLRLLRSHGQSGKYYHTLLGFNYRMTDVEAAIGREQLKWLDDMLSIRRQNATLLNEGFSDLPGIQPQKITTGSEHAWHQYCILVDEANFGCNRAVLASYLEEHGIATGIHYPRGLHQQPIFKDSYGKHHLPNTDYLAEHILALPVHHGLNKNDVNQIIEGVRSCCKK